jgi:patatin-like phospholipase/acyl hydrolase
LPDRTQILALSGGGFLGLYTATVLATLEGALGRPLARCFDLVAGTSVGGIIALALAAEVPAEDIKKAFERDGTRIFSNRPAPATRWEHLVDFFRSTFTSKYDGIALREAMATILDSDLRLCDLRHRVVIPAMDVTNGEIKIFRTPHHRHSFPDSHLAVSDIALATSAAPTFFPPVRINNSYYIDGGLFACSPAHIALHEAETALGVDAGTTHLLNVGTASARFSLGPKGPAISGADWMRNQSLLNSLLAGQQQITSLLVRARLGERYCSIDWDKTTSNTEQLLFDVATETAQRALRDAGHRTARAALENPVLLSMLAHIAEPYHRDKELDSAGSNHGQDGA